MTISCHSSRCCSDENTRTEFVANPVSVSTHPPPSPSCVSQTALTFEVPPKNSAGSSSNSTFSLPFSSGCQKSNGILTPRDQIDGVNTNTGGSRKKSAVVENRNHQSTDSAKVTPSSTSFSISNRGVTLSPVLRKPCIRTKASGSRCTPRRVRGLWNLHCNSLFSHVHDEVMLLIFSHLNLNELLQCSQVCRRWRYCSNHTHSWKQVDATEFLTSSTASPEETSHFIAKHLARHEATIESLTLSDIQYRLLPDVCLPSLSSMTNLCQLKLTGYASLTDAHVHAMLTASLVLPNFQSKSSRRHGRPSSKLTHLALEQCPLLTNLAVEFVAIHCPRLQVLSLRGNTKITSMLPLKKLWKCSQQPHQALASLQSLFDIPPASPSRGGSIPSSCGRLSSLDISHTGVTASELCQALSLGVSSSEKSSLRLTSLRMSGGGESWSNALLRTLLSYIDVFGLQTLDLSCANVFGRSHRLTDESMEELLREKLALRCVNLSGHTSITCKGVARLVASSPSLVDLDLGGCMGFVGTDTNAMDTLTLTLAKHGMTSSDGGLRRLSLWRCFPNRTQKEADEALAPSRVVEQFGKSILNALGSSPSAGTLSELDLGGCYFVSKDDVGMLNRRCPRLSKLRL